MITSKDQKVWTQVIIKKVSKNQNSIETGERLNISIIRYLLLNEQTGVEKMRIHKY